MTLAWLTDAVIGVLLGAALFTNAIEHIGSRFRVSEGVTASVFAAIATAMPEATIPVIAIVTHSGRASVRQQVATGAILGAPLMLSTVAFFVTGVAAALARGPAAALRPEPSGLRRDLVWFITAFGLAALATLVPEQALSLRAAIAALLVVMYLLYLLTTVRASAALVKHGHGTEPGRALFARRFRGFPAGLPGTLIQLVLGFVLIGFGTHSFLNVVSRFSDRVPPLLLSLIMIPIATELPEKVNSVLWIRHGRRDTLAFGNITGALVFQGTLLPALGIWLTPWTLRPDVIFSILLTLTAAGYLLIMQARGTLRPYHLAVNGACYVLYLLLMLLGHRFWNF
ncbi:MAG: sodium:calcium antiporter [Acidiferrobacteraceae bacterium]